MRESERSKGGKFHEEKERSVNNFTVSNLQKKISGKSESTIGLD